MKNVILSFACLFLIFSCSTDDGFSEPDPQSNLMDQRVESTMILTNNSSKVWRIYKATLINGSTSIDISNNFNVVDDEFIFSVDGERKKLEWRKGFDINTGATSLPQTLLDKYVSPTNIDFSFQDQSSTTIEADDASLVFDIISSNAILAEISNPNGSMLEFSLQEKDENDYLSAPENALEFLPAFSFTNSSISCCAPGMIGSNSDGSIYIVSRTREPNFENNELVQKFDPISKQLIGERIFQQSDFVSKQLHIIDNKLVVIGAQNVNVYDTDLSADPVSYPHGKKLSRFGISVLDDDAYIIGGDLDDSESDKIFKWNITDNSLSDFATLPQPKSGARGTIVNDHLYVFGGSETFFGTNPSDKIYSVNINDPSLTSEFSMNKAVDFTFVQKYRNLIYVAGQRIIERDKNTPTLNETVVGVFNTTDNTYQELSTNLTNPNDTDTIRQMCVFNGKMYIIYGEYRYNGDSEIWDVLVADLD